MRCPRGRLCWFGSSGNPAVGAAGALAPFAKMRKQNQSQFDLTSFKVTLTAVCFTELLFQMVEGSCSRLPTAQCPQLGMLPPFSPKPWRVQCRCPCPVRGLQSSCHRGSFAWPASHNSAQERHFPNCPELTSIYAELPPCRRFVIYLISLWSALSPRQRGAH